MDDEHYFSQKRRNVCFAAVATSQEIWEIARAIARDEDPELIVGQFASRTY